MIDVAPSSGTLVPSVAIGVVSIDQVTVVPVRAIVYSCQAMPAMPLVIVPVKSVWPWAEAQEPLLMLLISGPGNADW